MGCGGWWSAAGVKEWQSLALAIGADWSDVVGSVAGRKEHLRAQCVAQAALKSCDGAHTRDEGDKERQASVEG